MRTDTLSTISGAGYLDAIFKARVYRSSNGCDLRALDQMARNGINPFSPDICQLTVLP